MNPSFQPLALLALGLICSLGACATQAPGDEVGPGPPMAQAAPAYASMPPPAPEPAVQFAMAPAPIPPPASLLAAPPADAQPGECYAKVMVPGQPIPSPPAKPRAVWRLTPPAPGQAGPMWCLYFEAGVRPPASFSPERFGWIRVICDKDATAETIRHVQRRLGVWGYYHGAFDGHFDAETAHGVARFQEQQRINHGGYLSLATIQALNASPEPSAPLALQGRDQGPYSGPIASAPSFTSYGQRPGPCPGYACEPPPYPQAPVSMAGCGPSSCPSPPVGFCGGGQACLAPQATYGWTGGSAGGGFVTGSTPPYRSLLIWPGKSIY